MDERTATAHRSAGEVAAAAKVLREHGYSVVTATQAEMWETWLRQSHDREHELHEQVSRYAGECAFLADRVRDLLDGSRPAWYRAFRQRWNDYRTYHATVVPLDPRRTEKNGRGHDVD